jgi:hypothetical protein
MHSLNKRGEMAKNLQLGDEGTMQKVDAIIPFGMVQI